MGNRRRSRAPRGAGDLLTDQQIVAAGVLATAGGSPPTARSGLCSGWTCSEPSSLPIGAPCSAADRSARRSRTLSPDPVRPGTSHPHRLRLDRASRGGRPRDRDLRPGRQSSCRPRHLYGSPHLVAVRWAQDPRRHEPACRAAFARRAVVEAAGGTWSDELRAIAPNVLDGATIVERRWGRSARVLAA